MNKLKHLIGELGHHTIKKISRIGLFTKFLGTIFFHSLGYFRPNKIRLILKEIYASGVLSLIIITISGLFVGFVLGLQGYETLQKYGSEQSLGVIVALSLVRELGPVITALLFAGRAGTAITAEIGLMKTTEQLVAMQMMAIDPIERVIAPRFWGGVISMPILSSIFSSVGVIGGYIVGVLLIGLDDGMFWSQMQSSVNFQHDIVNGMIKSIVFAIAVTALALFEGVHAHPTAEGVSRATTRTVVNSSVAILALDFILTSFMFTGGH